MRGLLVAEGGDDRGAVAHYERVLSIDIANPLAHMLRALALLKIKDPYTSLSSFNAALSVSPQLLMALNGRGFVYLSKGEHEKAVTDFSAALKLHRKYLAGKG